MSILQTTELKKYYGAEPNIIISSKSEARMSRSLFSPIRIFD